MGVEYEICDNCGRVYPDCSIIRCECDAKFCEPCKPHLQFPKKDAIKCCQNCSGCPPPPPGPFDNIRAISCPKCTKVAKDRKVSNDALITWLLSQLDYKDKDAALKSYKEEQIKQGLLI